MIQLNGKYNHAKVFNDNVEETAMGQIIELCNQEFTQGSQIRMMPDLHAGAGCVIGTTMTIQDKIVPNLVGVDIGCGMAVAIIDTHKDDVNFDQLDDVIRKHIPHGFNIRGSRHKFADRVKFSDVRAPINLNRAENSIGTLGGGNHFIEVNETEDGRIMLVIHSGSRNLGKTVAEHYQNRAYDELMNINDIQERVINDLKAQGRQSEIQAALKDIKRPKFKKELAWLEGQSFQDYMHDMKIAQGYATLNRQAMVDEIVTRMGWTIADAFTTIHNYIDMDTMILRKGAISAQDGERVIIPINMRDGSIIATGKGNPDWNFSGPHGAGRLMSRSKAKELVDMAAFRETMDNVWTTSVNESTMDEAPFAYKPINEITDNIGESLAIEQIAKPLYNFKSN